MKKSVVEVFVQMSLSSVQHEVGDEKSVAPSAFSSSPEPDITSTVAEFPSTDESLTWLAAASVEQSDDKVW